MRCQLGLVALLCFAGCGGASDRGSAFDPRPLAELPSLPEELQNDRGAYIWAYTELHAQISTDAGDSWLIEAPLDLRSEHTTHVGDGEFAVDSWFTANKVAVGAKKTRVDWQGRVRFLGDEDWQIVHLNYASRPPWESDSP